MGGQLRIQAELDIAGGADLEMGSRRGEAAGQIRIAGRVHAVADPRGPEQPQRLVDTGTRAPATPSGRGAGANRATGPDGTASS